MRPAPHPSPLPAHGESARLWEEVARTLRIPVRGERVPDRAGEGFMDELT
jgi:hypothetical protein